ncbi:MAG TPA: PilZ domain-containing protein [Devosia sp.]|jgi:hypothetical protein|nr:PilZ domain-containing protein [Devosia sp.]
MLGLNNRADDVRFIGALSGRYALSERKTPGSDVLPVFACRLCSISPLQAVMIGPELPVLGEMVALHSPEFGMLRGRTARLGGDSFAIDFDIDEGEREKLTAKIRWKKANVHRPHADKRNFPRTLPRRPRTLLTQRDGTRMPCFLIDISRSGAAISAKMQPRPGTVLAVGALWGKVVRPLEVGFAFEFLEVQGMDDLEQRLLEPPAPLG